MTLQMQELTNVALPCTQNVLMRRMPYRHISKYFALISLLSAGVLSPWALAQAPATSSSTNQANAPVQIPHDIALELQEDLRLDQLLRSYNEQVSRYQAQIAVVNLLSGNYNAKLARHAH